MRESACVTRGALTLMPPLRPSIEPVARSATPTFTTPARFTFLIRALMTLEGISVQMNPDFNFFDVAGPYARDFLFRRGASTLRTQVVDSLRDARSGRLDWARVWRMAKSAYALYSSER